MTDTPDTKIQLRDMSISPRSTIREALQAIERGTLGVALVIDPASQRFDGLLTDGDLRRALLAGQGLESAVGTVQHPPTTTGRVGMSSEELMSLVKPSIRVVPLLDERGRVQDLAVLDRRVRLPIAEPQLGERELTYVTECVLTGWVSSAGKFVGQFEEMFARFCDTKYALATSNGTTALHLALLALKIGPGDEVIVPTLTFIATANAVRYTGATPVFVDSEPVSWGIDPARIEAAITPRTKAIVPVHLYGHPADMGPILAIAERHGLAVVEDAAEAHGARWCGRVVGGIGDIGVFSFYGNKIITTGEGGMVTTNRRDLYDAMRLFRDHGMSPERRYWHTVVGYNYRLTNLQAALGVAQMERIDGILARKREIAAAYTHGLSRIPGLTLPGEASWASAVYWLYSIVIDEAEFGWTRDEVMAYLKDHDVETRPVFPLVHQQPCYDLAGRFDVAERLSAFGLSLPSAVTLQPAAVDRIVSLLAHAHGARRGSPRAAVARSQPIASA